MVGRSIKEGRDGSRSLMVRLLVLVWISLAASASLSAASFRNDVMAVLSKSGCNAGTCHGNKNGKGGFKLSLRGQDPDLDYASLTRDLLGRRSNPLQPEESLILLKPTARIAHEGGLRFTRDSREYEILRDWIARGMPNDLLSAPRLETIDVSPAERVLLDPEDRVQLQVLARFSDGTTRDVTSLAVLEPANTLVKVMPQGLVVRESPVVSGETTVLVRYLHRQTPVRLAFVPDRPGFKWKAPPANNYIDEHVFAKLRTLRINPSELCSDEVFLRRAYLDLLGILPTPEEARAFMDVRSHRKRAELIDHLLTRPEFPEFWTLKWADLLRVEAHSLDQKGVQNFYNWIRRGLIENKPLDQFVRELITARGSTYTTPAANYYRPHRNPAARARAAAQVFLGARLQCAECHNHPSDRWTQDDYYDWAGLFARVRYKVIENNREISSDEHEWNGEQIIFIAREGSFKNPRTGQNASPRFLGATVQVNHEKDSLETLAEWLTSPTNAWFARVQVNRIWSQLLGRGLVDPPDDFRATNPASHPALLDALAADFVRRKFDVRHLIRRIMNSRVYQLSSEPNDTNRDDQANFSRPLVRRLGAEQLLDCQSQVAGVSLKFTGYPAGLRAAQLPGVRPESKGKRRANQLDQFLEIFGKPPRLLTTDAERSCECNMNQAFQMISGPTVNDLLAEKENRVSRLLAGGKSNREIIGQLYWTALTRAPSEAELRDLMAILDSAADRRAELEDVLWGLLNSKDFLFRR
jgi:hypothetical protein